MALRRMLLQSSTSFVKTAGRPAQSRFYSSSSKEEDFVTLHPSGKPHIVHTPVVAVSDDLDDDDEEDTVAIGPSGTEYGGPTRGGKLKEPTRYGDWERKGRCSDF
ncbi:unnamed protein product [Peronospora farinosa]|uniref:Succinate dehydrogenase assembly factor 4, mitochondrial n=1 Tax=Peronospora farinosa TaxID=134698 RepID=A0AAV0UGX8_9STRA|nr:unnamed protein product [Peronospora farinosa]CAI5734755.1 unnamed protein product [Peronospora farinosa]